MFILLRVSYTIFNKITEFVLTLGSPTQESCVGLRGGAGCSEVIGDYRIGLGGLKVHTHVFDTPVVGAVKNTFYFLFFFIFWLSSMEILRLVQRPSLDKTYLVVSIKYFHILFPLNLKGMYTS